MRVHRNHGFEPVSSGTAAYGAWNGLAFEWIIGAYDDSLSFDMRGDADIEVIWLDSGRLRDTLGNGLGEWLVARLQALRSLTDNPILALIWPLAPVEREFVNRASGHATYVPDLEVLAAEAGNRWLDRRTETISGTRLSNQACLRVARELACCWLPATRIPPLKAVAVDLDGTLFDGVLGEDGPSGLELTAGHLALQNRLAKLRQQGVLLAVVSRNEMRDVEDLFARRTDFPLRLDDFSAVEASWDDKAASVERIATKLRIGADSVVFVDDNPGELVAVATSSPVFTVHARPDGAETEIALAHVAGLFRWRESVEDRLRADDLLASESRFALAGSTGSAEDYFRSLRVRLGYFVGSRKHLSRVAELVLKTNQFNLSLRRMREVEIARRLEELPSNVISIRLVDRLSDSGIVGVLIGSREGDSMRVEEICVSCRALGRGLEDSMMTQALLLLAGDRAPCRFAFDLRNGPRNGPARQWLAQYAHVDLADATDRVDMPFEAVVAKPGSSVIQTEVIR